MHNVLASIELFYLSFQDRSFLLYSHESGVWEPLCCGRLHQTKESLHVSHAGLVCMCGGGGGGGVHYVFNVHVDSQN